MFFSKDMIMYAFLSIIIVAALAVGMPKLSSMKVMSKATNITDTVGTLRVIANQYIAASTTQDLQNINVETLVTNNLIPGNYKTSGSGDSSYLVGSFDTKIKFYITDPYASSTSAGNYVKIKIDASGLGYDSKDMQVLENKLKNNLEGAGGTIKDYESSGADGTISVIFG